MRHHLLITRIGWRVCVVAIACVAAIPLVSRSPVHASDSTRVLFQDAFLDGSRRTGPPMIHIPATRFVMGSATTELGFAPRESRHRVSLSAYAIGQTEVTNAEFCAFLNAEGNRRERDEPWLRLDPDAVRIRPEGQRFVVEPGYERHPVVGVTWLGARAYTRWLTKSTGHHYRLPTEAEWECAARAGTATPWPWGDRFDPARMNWRGTQAATSTLPVGSFAPNAWGIQDMLGNVWEWALDDFSERFYLISPQRDPVNFDAEAMAPVIRGGSFRDSLEFCRPGFRINYPWIGNTESIGFRVTRHEP